MSKDTNAATNKLKEDAWVSLTSAFNAKCGSIPKGKEQLKAKWDKAQKRSTLIRMNNLKTGGGKPDFIPPDEILEKVANILGATCTGFAVPFGGDGTVAELDEEELQVVAEEDQVFDVVTVQLPDNNITPNTSGAKKRKINFIEEGGVGDVGVKILYGMPTMAKSLQNKGKKKKIEDGSSDILGVLAHVFLRLISIHLVWQSVKTNCKSMR